MDALLSGRALRGFRIAFAERADQLVDELLRSETVDGVTDIAEAFPLRVFSDVVGLSEQVRPHLLTYGDLVFNSGGPQNRLFTDALSRAEPAIAAITEQTARERLRPGGLGASIWDAVDAGDLTPDEAPQMIRALLSAGFDTTVAAIAASLLGLASNPAQWRAVRDDPRRSRFAFEEAIRHDTPVQTFYRTALRPAELGGTTIPRNSKVFLSLAAAHTDPRRFADAHRFDIARNPSGHVGFGVGIHQCVGQHFARLEGQAILGALARKVTTLELVGEPVRRLNNSLRTWSRLPLRFGH